jgi:hypothetical protein
MLLKILVIGAVAIGLMAAIKDGRVLRDAGLLSSCNVAIVNGKAEPTVMSCSKGRLDGFPNLANKSCRLISDTGIRQLWHCAEPIVSSQAPNG